MNKSQVKLLHEYAQRLERLDDELSSIVSCIEDMKDTEENKYDNLPESLQESSRGEDIQEAIERLEDVLSYLEDHEYSDAVDLLNEF